MNNKPIIAGWIEKAFVGEEKISMNAKLDTGAKTSSIHAPGYIKFIRDDQEWVKFILRTKKDKTLNVEEPILRTASIRRAKIGVVTRPVIKLKICLAGFSEETEFTLTDRSEMNYPLLIGRRFLGDRILVNSDATYLTNKNCKN